MSATRLIAGVVTVFVALHLFDLPGGAAASPRDREEPVLRIAKWKQRKAGEDADDLERRRIEKYNSALQVVQLRILLIGERSDLSDNTIQQMALLLVDAALELTKTQAERVAVLEDYVAYMKYAENSVR